jgi:hypothetical protein
MFVTRLAAHPKCVWFSTPTTILQTSMYNNPAFYPPIEKNKEIMSLGVMYVSLYVRTPLW